MLRLPVWLTEIPIREGAGKSLLIEGWPEILAFWAQAGSWQQQWEARQAVWLCTARSLWGNGQPRIWGFLPRKKEQDVLGRGTPAWRRWSGNTEWAQQPLSPPSLPRWSTAGICPLLLQESPRLQPSSPSASQAPRPRPRYSSVQSASTTSRGGQSWDAQCTLCPALYPALGPLSNPLRQQRDKETGSCQQLSESF